MDEGDLNEDILEDDDLGFRQRAKGARGASRLRSRARTRSDER